MEWALLLFGIFAFGVLPEIFEVDEDFDPKGLSTNGNGTSFLDDISVDNADGVPDSGPQAQAEGQNDIALSEPYNSIDQAEVAAEEAELAADIQAAKPTQGPEPVDVTDFDVNEDILVVTVDASAADVDAEIHVTPSQDGEDGNVYMNNQLIAVLTGAPEATPEDVFLSVAKVTA